MDGQSWTITWGAGIRQFFRDLFGSRLIDRLEMDLTRLRNDMDERLFEKEKIIASLREEKQLLMSKVAMLETVVMPRASREGAEFVRHQTPTKPNFSFVDMPPPKSKWEQYQESYYKEEAEKEKASAEAK